MLVPLRAQIASRPLEPTKQRIKTMSSNPVLGNLIHTMSNKSYGEGVNSNQQRLRLAAERLAPGNLPEILSSLTKGEDPIISESDVGSFLEKQRKRILKVAEANVNDNNEIAAFKSALAKLQAKINQEQTESLEVPDYEQIIEDLMKAQRNEQKATQLPLEQEMIYRETCEAMGMACDGGQDEEDIMVVNSGGSNTLKCPLTATLFEDPVKNKLCSHIYSKTAILEYIQSGQRACPVPACSNSHLSKDQLEEDRATSLLVRRERRRLEREEQNRVSQALNLDDDDI